MTNHTPSLSDIDIKLLRVFCTIVECNGFSEAQTELNISRSTISTHMANLETRLGFKLCKRGRAGFALTSRGRAVFESSRTLLSSIEGYYTQMAHLKDQILGEVTIGVVDNIITNSDCLLHRAIRLSMEHTKGLRINLTIAPSDQIEEQLVRGQIDLAIAPAFRDLKSISQRALFDEKQRLFCGRHHPLFDVEDDQLTEDLIARQNHVRRAYVSLLTPYSSVFRNTAFAVSQQMEGLAYFVLSGLYVGFLPDDFAEYWVRKGEMRVLKPDVFGFDIPICLSRGNSKEPSVAAEHIYDTLMSVYRLAPEVG